MELCGFQDMRDLSELVQLFASKVELEVQLYTVGVYVEVEF